MQTLDAAATEVDKDLELQHAKLSSAAVRSMLKWINPDVVMHASFAALLTGAIYMLEHFLDAGGTHHIRMSIGAHMLTGVVLGLLLVCRVVGGHNRASEAAAQVHAFNKCCRTLAVHATFVSETLTIPAGAEPEKRGVSTFRYELVRLLNLSFYCYQLMLKGLKLRALPSVLPPSMSAEVLSAVSNPTVLVCKWIADLVEKQQAAERIKPEHAAVIMAEIGRMLDSYHTTHALLLSPMPASLNGFTYFFVVIWTYTAAPMIAYMVRGRHPPRSPPRAAPRVALPTPPPPRVERRTSRATTSSSTASGWCSRCCTGSLWRSSCSVCTRRGM